MAYYLKKDDSPVIDIPYLPKMIELNNKQVAVLDRYSEADEQGIYEIYKHVINVESDSYPYYEIDSIDEFRICFMSRDTFVLKEPPSENATTAQVVGAFYVKPNYPGRSSHICNGGFIVHPNSRGIGAGTAMGRAMLPIARDLKYKAVMYNLVYVNNTASLRLWRKLGFKEIGRIPNAGLMNDGKYYDSIQFYYDLDRLTEDSL